MLFTKEELIKEVEKTELNDYLKVYPFKTKANPGDKTPFQLVFSNKIHYFDQSSHKVKEILYKTRKAITEKCFTSINESVYPNELQIERCVAENQVEFTDLLHLREKHFANVMNKFQTDVKNCASNDDKCRIDAEKAFVWNCAKLPFFFSETH